MQARVQAAAAAAAAANTKADKTRDNNNKGLLVAGAGAAAVALVGYLVYRAFSALPAAFRPRQTFPPLAFSIRENPLILFPYLLAGLFILINPIRSVNGSDMMYLYCLLSAEES